MIHRRLYFALSPAVATTPVSVRSRYATRIMSVPYYPVLVRIFIHTHAYDNAFSDKYYTTSYNPCRGVILYLCYAAGTTDLSRVRPSACNGRRHCTCAVPTYTVFAMSTVTKCRQRGGQWRRAPHRLLTTQCFSHLPV